MHKYITLLLIIFAWSVKGQNVGVGTLNPTNPLHIKPLNLGATDPLKVEGFQPYLMNDSALLVVDPSDGSIRYMFFDSLIQHLDIAQSGNLDSLIQAIVNSSLDSFVVTQAFIDSVSGIIYNYGDTLLSNTTFIDSSYAIFLSNLLSDTAIQNLILSLQTDVDSLYLINTTLWLHEDSVTLTADLSPIIDSSLSFVFQNIVDSLLQNTFFTDSIYDISFSQLVADTNFWAILDSADSDIDSAQLLGADLIIYEDGDSIIVNLSALSDSDWVQVGDTLYSTDSTVVIKNGGLGIGTLNPDTTLHIVGKIKIQDGQEREGYVLISDSTGLASWADLDTLNAKDDQIWYVSSFYGVDSTAIRGNRYRPFRTLQEAMDTALSGELIYLLPGAYGTNDTLLNGGTIQASSKAVIDSIYVSNGTVLTDDYANIKLVVLNAADKVILNGDSLKVSGLFHAGTAKITGRSVFIDEMDRTSITARSLVVKSQDLYSTGYLSGAYTEDRYENSNESYESQRLIRLTTNRMFGSGAPNGKTNYNNNVLVMDFGKIIDDPSSFRTLFYLESDSSFENNFVNIKVGEYTSAFPAFHYSEILSANGESSSIQIHFDLYHFTGTSTHGLLGFRSGRSDGFTPQVILSGRYVSDSTEILNHAGDFASGFTLNDAYLEVKAANKAVLNYNIVNTSGFKNMTLLNAKMFNDSVTNKISITTNTTPLKGNYIDVNERLEYKLEYGQGDKEATDFAKTESDYLAVYGTDGSLLEFHKDSLGSQISDGNGIYSGSDTLSQTNTLVIIPEGKTLSFAESSSTDDSTFIFKLDPSIQNDDPSITMGGESNYANGARFLATLGTYSSVFEQYESFSGTEKLGFKLSMGTNSSFSNHSNRIGDRYGALSIKGAFSSSAFNNYNVLDDSNTSMAETFNSGFNTNFVSGHGVRFSNPLLHSFNVSIGNPGASGNSPASGDIKGDGSNRFAVQTVTSNSAYYDWIKVLLPSSNPANGDHNISFYNEKYAIPNAQPSIANGDTSIMIWAGNTTGTNPTFINKNLFNDQDWTLDGDTMYSAIDSTVTIKNENVGVNELNPNTKFVVHVDGNHTAIGDVDAQTITSGITGNAVEMGPNASGFNIQSSDNFTIPFALNLNPFGGNVGIGTTAPISKLHVNDGHINLQGASSDFNILTTGGTFAARLASFTAGSGRLQIYNVAGTDNVVIDGRDNVNSYINTGGNFGIGTNAPARTLDVDGDVSIINTSSNDSYIQLSNGAHIWEYNSLTGRRLRINGTGLTSGGNNWFEARFDGGNNKVFLGADGSTSYIQGGHNIKISADVAGNPNTSFNPDLFIERNGNIGINTSNPGTRLHVHNDIVGLDSVFVVDFDGNTGIGTISPDAKLHVVATSDPIKVEGLQLDNSLDTIVTIDANQVLHKAHVQDVLGVTYNNVLFVAENGDNATAEAGNPNKPFADPWTAAAAASSGDMIYCYPGQYNQNTLGLTGSQLFTQDSMTVYSVGSNIIFNTQLNSNTVTTLHLFAGDMENISTAFTKSIALPSGIGEINYHLNAKYWHSNGATNTIDDDDADSGNVYFNVDHFRLDLGYYLFAINNARAAVGELNLYFNCNLYEHNPEKTGNTALFRGVAQFEGPTQNANLHMNTKKAVINTIRGPINFGFNGGAINSSLYWKADEVDLDTYGAPTFLGVVYWANGALSNNSAYIDFENANLNNIPISNFTTPTANNKLIVRGNFNLSGQTYAINTSTSGSNNILDVDANIISDGSGVFNIQSNISLAKLSGKHEISTAATPVINATSSNIELRDWLGVNDGTVSAISATSAIDVEVAGAFDANTKIEDPDISFIRLDEYGSHWNQDDDTLYSAIDSTVVIKNGNVGIGKLNPEVSLDISDKLRITRPFGVGNASSFEILDSSIANAGYYSTTRMGVQLFRLSSWENHPNGNRVLEMWAAREDGSGGEAPSQAGDVLGAFWYSGYSASGTSRSILLSSVVSSVDANTVNSDFLMSVKNDGNSMNDRTEAFRLHHDGHLTWNFYGSGNKESSDLTLSKSNYLARFATDGTVVEYHKDSLKAELDDQDWTLDGDTLYSAPDSTLVIKDGNVGIGTLSPSHKIDVDGIIGISGNQALYYPSSDFPGTLVLGNGGTNLSNTVAIQGQQNTFIGIGSGEQTTTGSGNVSVGYDALKSNTSGYENIAIGPEALITSTTAVNNTAVGAYAMQLATTGSFNTAFGTSALSQLTTARRNTAIGYQALIFCNADDNIGLGYFAGKFAIGTVSNTAASQSIFIGSNSKANANGESNQIVIGYEAEGNGSNSVTLGNNSITKTILKGSVGIGTPAPANSLHIVAGTDPIKADGLVDDSSLDTVVVVDNGVLHKRSLSRAMYSPISTQSANYTALITDEVILVDASAGDVTITLPTASGIAGKKYYFKKDDGTANNVIIDGNGAETIDGNATVSTNVAFQGWTMISDGTNWKILY
ncbi:MAG: hypothetical protein MRY83_12275 [Flavobacteriales bacterium]|nr:hypothetical protein [Flavobacteriales bacterium]